MFAYTIKKTTSEGLMPHYGTHYNQHTKTHLYLKKQQNKKAIY